VAAGKNLGRQQRLSSVPASWQLERERVLSSLELTGSLVHSEPMVDHTLLVGEPADLHLEVDDLSEGQIGSSRRREVLDEVGAVLGCNRVDHELHIIAKGSFPAPAQHPTETKPSLQRGQGFFSR